jgi:hypothetical protein
MLLYTGQLVEVAQNHLPFSVGLVAPNRFGYLWRNLEQVAKLFAKLWSKLLRLLDKGKIGFPLPLWNVLPFDCAGGPVKRSLAILNDSPDRIDQLIRQLLAREIGFVVLFDLV